MKRLKKQQFFALYWGQKVLCDDEMYAENFELKESNLRITTKPFLMLKSLANISDEDAIEVAKIVKRKYLSHYKEGEITFKVNKGNTTKITLYWNSLPQCMVELTESEINNCDIRGIYASGGDYYYTHNQKEAFDYLILKGYALSFKQYSVEDLVKESVIKLI